jgi:hypothetical protein
VLQLAKKLKRVDGCVAESGVVEDDPPGCAGRLEKLIREAANEG